MLSLGRVWAELFSLLAESSQGAELCVTESPRLCFCVWYLLLCFSGAILISVVFLLHRDSLVSGCSWPAAVLVALKFSKSTHSP
ncbi:hypothetical protein ACET3Z_010321 [Daucus carota]